MIREVAASLGVSVSRAMGTLVVVNDGNSVFELNGTLDGLGNGSFDRPSDAGFCDGDFEGLAGGGVIICVDGIGVGVTDGTKRPTGTLLYTAIPISPCSAPAETARCP